MVIPMVSQVHSLVLERFLLRYWMYFDFFPHLANLVIPLVLERFVPRFIRWKVVFSCDLSVSVGMPDISYTEFLFASIHLELARGYS